MKKIRVEDAIGMELCHDITAMYDGFKGAAFRRGHIIRKEDVPKLLDYGKQTVFVWEENAGEIHEEDAAKRMSAMVPVKATHYTEPYRCYETFNSDTCLPLAIIHTVNQICIDHHRDRKSSDTH